MLPNPVEVVKKAAVEAVEAGKPVVLLFGKVISDSPLKIQVDQKTILTEKMLILTRNVTDFDVEYQMALIFGPASHLCKRRTTRPRQGPPRGFPPRPVP